MTIKCCDRCKYAVPDDKKVLWCRYAPPRAVPLPDGRVTYTPPAVPTLGWCGAFRLSLKRLFKGHVGA